jgi:ATP adenylyltransferase/5',5'''-P-1,P-4-tetraphosphate phosphorylase II
MFWCTVFKTHQMFTEEAKQYGNKKNKTTDRHHGKILDSSETQKQYNLIMTKKYIHILWSL